MTQIAINGHTYSDDGSLPNDMLNGGHRTKFFPLVQDVVVVAGQAAASQAAAAVSASQALGVAAAMLGTSTTSVTVGAGSKTWTTQTGKQFTVGAFATVARTSDPNTLVHGVVTAYNSGTGALTINVATVQGAGTFADWSISLSGAAGPTGASGNGSVGYAARTSAYTLLTTDRAKLNDCTSGTFTLGFQAAATLGAGWMTTIRNSGAGIVTLDPSAAELIDGATTLDVAPGHAMSVVCDGVALRTYALGLNRLWRLPIMQANVGVVPASALENLGTVLGNTNLASISAGSIAFGSSLFVCASAAASGSVSSSADAITWTLRTMPSSAVWTIGSDGTNFLSVVPGATNTATSSNGTAWAAATALPAAITTPLQPVKVAGLWIAAGSGATTYYTSTDGVTWSTRTLPAAPVIYGLRLVGATAWVRTGPTTAYTSTDGINWTVRTLPSNYSTLAVTADGALVGFVFTSAGWERTTDGITWSAAGTPPAVAGHAEPYCLLNGVRIFSDSVSAMTNDAGVWVPRFDPQRLVIGSSHQCSIYATTYRGVIGGKFLTDAPGSGYLASISPNTTSVLGLFV